MWRLGDPTNEKTVDHDGTKDWSSGRYACAPMTAGAANNDQHFLHLDALLCCLSRLTQLAIFYPDLTRISPANARRVSPVDINTLHQMASTVSDSGVSHSSGLPATTVLSRSAGSMTRS